MGRRPKATRRRSRGSSSPAPAGWATPSMPLRGVPPAEGQYFETINPATKAVLARVAQGSKADVDAAVAAANVAAPIWAGLTTHARARFLYALAREVQPHSRLL